MAYFNRLPEITYNKNECVDLHKKLVLASPIEDEWLTTYDLLDGETLHDVSYKLYGTVDYWWILSLINYYDDVHYDMFIKDDVLQKLAKQLQVMELPNKTEYLFFPPNAKIQYEFGGDIYTGTVIKKYIMNVSGEGEKFLIDVLLDNVNVPMPSNIEITILDTTLNKIELASDTVFVNGDIVRQDKYWDDKLEDFARGVIIYKDANYIYVHKTKSTPFTITQEIYTQEDGKEIVGNEMILSKKTYVDGEDIVDVQLVNTFQLQEYGLRDLYYIYRYDKLVEINDQKSKLKVVKPSYVNILKNNIIINEEGI